MSKKEIKKYQIISAIIVFILGTLLHFTYNFFDENKFIGIISSINESVWEHLKLIFFPMIFNTIVGYIYIGKKIPNFLCSKTIGIITAILTMIVFFYTYSGILGKNIAIVDILSFYIIVALGEFVSYIFMINRIKCNNKLSVAILLVILLLFVVFTFKAPPIGIFKDPIIQETQINRN